jgi:Na+-transporting methylmalonyl-CoA/oxaloacetate decarboxylase gamma subunit
VKFDLTVNLGTVIAFLTLLIVILRTYNNIIVRQLKIESRVNMMWSKFRKRLEIDDEDEYDGR